MLRSATLLAATALLLAGPAFADDVKDAADRALKADPTELKELARLDEPDPWLVADELCARGEFERALAFARAAPRFDVERLPAYVESRRGKTKRDEARAAFAATEGMAPSAALEVLAGLSVEPDDLLSVRLLHTRGGLHFGQRRWREATEALVAAIERAQRLGWHFRTSGLLNLAGMCAFDAGDWASALRFAERNSALQERRGDASGLAAALTNAGRVYSVTGRKKQALALFERALSVVPPDDRARLGPLLVNLGSELRGLGELERAIDYHRRAKDLYEASGDRSGVVIALLNIGNVQTDRGAIEPAARRFEEALRLAEEDGDPGRTSSVLASLGSARVNQGRYAEARDLFQRALGIQRKLGSPNIGNTLRLLGGLYGYIGDFGKAQEHLREALEIAEQVGIPANVAHASIELGKVLALAGRHKEALEPNLRALKLAQELRHPTIECEALGQLGGVYRKLREFSKARDHYLRALEGMRAIGTRSHEVAVLGNLGELHASEGDYEAALDYYEKSLALGREVGAVRNRAVVLGNIAVVHQGRGEYDRAIEYHERSLRVSENMGDRPLIATTWSNLGELHRSRAHYDKALECYERALRMKQGLSKPASLALTVAGIGDVHADRGRYEEALGAFRRALQLCETAGNDLGVAESMGRIARALSALGRYEESLEYQTRALALLRRGGYRRSVGTAIGSIGRLHWLRGDYTCALELMLEAHGILEKTGSRKDVATSHGNLAVLFRTLGDHERANDHRRRSEKLLEELGSREAMARVLALRGNALVVQGDYAGALECRERLAEIREQLGQLPELARVLERVGNTHYLLGDTTRAFVCYERSLSIYRECGHRAGVALALGNLGGAYLELGKVTRAVETLAEARELMMRLEHGKDLSTVLINLGTALRRAGRHQEAAAALNEAIASDRKRGNPLHLAHAFAGLARIRWGRGEPERAVEFQREAVALSRVHEPNLTHDFAAALGRLLVDGIDDPAEAIPCFEEAIAAIEAQRSQARLFNDDRFFRHLRSSWRPYEGMALAQIRSGRPAEALAYLERGRARGVLDLLARSRVDPVAAAERRAREQGDSQRVEELARVRAELLVADREARALSHALSAPRAEASRAALASKLRTALRTRDDLVARRARLVRALVPVGASASVAEIQRLLRPSDRMLFYSVGESRTFAFLVGPAGADVRAVELKWSGGRPLTRATLADAVADQVRSASRADRGVTTPDKEAPVDTGAAAARLLAALVPEAFREELRAARTLYLVPDASLHRLSFEGLPGWLDRYPPIAYVHSGSVLAWCRQRRSDQKPDQRRYEVVALGDPIFTRDASEPVAAPAEGVLVTTGRSPLAVGDVLLAYDGRPLKDAAELRDGIRRVEDEVEGGRAGAISVRVWRAGAELTLTVKAGPLGIEVAQEPPRAAWPKLRDRSVATLQRSGFGPLRQLPGTRREVASIRDTMKENDVVVLTGETATKRRLFELAPKARYLHLATHQLVDETDRLGRSRLALTAPRLWTPADDGFLSLFDLFEQWRDRLSGCELVVLSACETAKGRLQRDEGPYAMPLGFLYAGAPAVIGSLWRVDDASTAELFADFYRRLKAGTPKLAAFTEARKALKKKYPDPYHWAAFIFIGDPE